MLRNAARWMCVRFRQSCMKSTERRGIVSYRQRFRRIATPERLGGSPTPPSLGAFPAVDEDFAGTVPSMPSWGIR